MTKIAFFATRASTYGDQFLQTEATRIGNAELLILDEEGGDGCKPSNRMLRAIDYRAARTAKQRGLNLGAGPLTTLKLARRIQKFDAVYTLFANDAVKLLPAMRLMNHRLPWIVHCAGGDVSDQSRHSPFYLEQLGDVFRHATRIHCGSEYLLAKSIELGAPPHKTSVRYLGVDVAGVLPARSLAGCQNRIRVFFITVGRLVPVKGTTETISAFIKAFRSGDPVQLEIVGDGPLRQSLEQLVADEGRSHQILFSGLLPRDEVLRRVADSDVYVQHAIRDAGGQEEGLGGSIIEAMALGKPVISTWSGGKPEAVEDGVSGILVPIGDLEAMSRAMIQLVAQPVRRQTLGLEGVRLAAERFNPTTQTQLLKDEFERLATRRWIHRERCIATAATTSRSVGR